MSDIKHLVYSAMRDRDKEELEKSGSVEYVFGIKGLGSFKCNVYHQSGLLSATYEYVPFGAPAWKSYRLPKTLAVVPRPGLHLIGGDSAQARTLFLRSYLSMLDSSWKKKCLIFSKAGQLYLENTRLLESFCLGEDIRTLEEAMSRLRAARGDVMAFDHIYDLEGRTEILNTAGSGIPVVATAIGNSAEEVITNFYQDMPPHYIKAARRKLAQSLEWIFVQQSVCGKAGKIWPVFEILMADQELRRTIATGSMQDISQTLNCGLPPAGSKSIYEDLMVLVDYRRVPIEIAKASAPDADLFDKLWSQYKLEQLLRNPRKVFFRLWKENISKNNRPVNRRRKINLLHKP